MLSDVLKTCIDHIHELGRRADGSDNEITRRLPHSESAPSDTVSPQSPAEQLMAGFGSLSLDSIAAWRRKTSVPDRISGVIGGLENERDEMLRQGRRIGRIVERRLVLMVTGNILHYDLQASTGF